MLPVYDTKSILIVRLQIWVVINIFLLSLVPDQLWSRLVVPARAQSNEWNRNVDSPTYGNTRFSRHGNLIHNIIPLLKKENVYLYHCHWGYNNYVDAYFQFAWEDMALEVTVYSVKIMDITCKTNSAELEAELPWLVDLASLVCNMGCWLCCRLSVLHSVVTCSISSEGDHGIHCWWDLIKSNQLSSVYLCHAQVFAGFSGHGNAIHNTLEYLINRIWW